jgi:putative ABC transport system ATP-binding protein
VSRVIFGKERGVLIDINDLNKSHRDRQGQPVPVLKGLRLQVDRGEFVAVMGKSGCGKSTLLNILGCLERPEAGTYRLDGQDVGTWSERRRAELRNRQIGFVFQSFHLLPFLTVRENVELPFLYARDGQRPDRGRVQGLLASVGLEGKEGRYPGELSGGEQQRVAVARALVFGADLILGDEPTGNLDAATTQEVLNLFERLVDQGKTVLIVTHDPAVAARARRWLRLEEGKMQENVPATVAPIPTEVGSL